MNFKRFLAIIILVFSVLTSSATTTNAASFQGLGFLPEDGNSSSAYAISADGSTVVGQGSRSPDSIISTDYPTTEGSIEFPLDYPFDPNDIIVVFPPTSISKGPEAFRWTTEGGMVSLGFLSESDHSSKATTVSASGSVIAGKFHSSLAIGNESAFRWTSESGMVGLGSLGSTSSGSANGVSADGAIIVGQSGNHPFSPSQAFRWTLDSGMVNLGSLPADTPSSQASAISADGTTIVGYSGNYTGISIGVISSGPQAFRWSLNEGMVGLGHLSENSFSYAKAVSADGSTIVGSNSHTFYTIDDNGSISSGTLNPEAFIWTFDDGMMGLGDLPGGNNRSIANGVSADGSIVIGYGNSEFGQEAFVWDEVNGMRSLRDVLVDRGLDLSGWILSEATGISADGLTIVGNGTNPEGKNEAWIASLVEPVYYVDGVYGSDDNDGRSVDSAFATIQFGIDAAVDGDSVFVLPDVYFENIVFDGKAITVQGVGGAPVIDGQGYCGVSFFNGEGLDSVLKNVTVTNSFWGVFIAGSSPTLCNINVAGNKFGIEAYSGSQPDVVNCILWDNSDGDVFGCEVYFCCVQRLNETLGVGIISEDPMFVDPANGNYRLKSKRGRYWAAHDVWVLDDFDSPCINGGSFDFDPAGEPLPNGGRINLGAFGGTDQASLSDYAIAGDINRDGGVDMNDMAIVAANWLRFDRWPQQDNEDVLEGIALISAMKSRMEIIKTNLDRMEELAMECATGYYSDDQRLIMNSEFAESADEIERIASSTAYNGIKMLNSSTGSVSITTPDGVLEFFNVDLTKAGLGIETGSPAGINISIPDSAIIALGEVTEAIEIFDAAYELYVGYLDELSNQL